MKAPPLSERAFQQRIIDLARMKGWLVYHTYDSRRSEPGFPDLCLARERVVFLEVKSEIGKLSPAQRIWLARLEKAGAEVHTVKPSDWAFLIELLN